MEQPATYSDGNKGKAKPSLRSKILNERTILLSVFWALIGLTGAFLMLDFRTIYQQANAPLPGETDRREPLVMAPPKQRDNVRPYLPRTMPMTSRRKAPRMPGYAKPVAAPLVAKRMTFVRGPKGEASAVGRIEPGTAKEFADFLDGQNGEVRVVYLHSPGGSVQDALSMSKLIRAKEIKTTVPSNAYCASSCPIVFSGGKARIVGRPAWVGVHQVFAVGDAPGSLADGMSRGQKISAEVVQHLVKMGVDPRAWVHAMQTPSNQLYLFTRKQLKNYKIATELKSG